MLLLYVTDTKPLFQQMMQHGDLHERLENQANLFLKGHVELLNTDTKRSFESIRAIREQNTA